ncbi:lipocalin family protein [bacterium]|nr:lipocalin family protein [bacterium]
MIHKRVLTCASVALFFVLTSILTSCNRYPDGPGISFRSKEERVTNTWQAQLISRNELDETKDYEYMTLNFNSNGTFEWVAKKIGDNEEKLSTTWELASADNQIKLSYNDGSPVNPDKLLYFDISRLKEDELWIDYVGTMEEDGVFLTDGDNFSLRLIPL